MKIVFLDVDGVLNSKSYMLKLYSEINSNGLGKIGENGNLYISDVYSYFSPEYMLNLKEFIAETNAKIVISSTWRLSYPDGDSWKKLISNFKEYNLDSYIIDITDNQGPKRGDEIRRWLDRHKEIESFVIIDDDSDMCEFTATYLAKTSWETGFIKEVKDQALEILRRLLNDN